MDDIPTFLKDAIQVITEGKGYRRPRGLFYDGTEDFILKHGRHWTPAPFPSRYPWGVDGEAFRNAAKLAFSFHELVYCEGYAVQPEKLIPEQHAWCADAQGRVVDNTWFTYGEEYFGVPLRTRLVTDQMYRQARYGIIQAMERGFPLLKIPPDRASEFTHGPAYRLPKFKPNPKTKKAKP